MKRAFNIYPALLMITPVMQEEATQATDNVSGKDCLFNENRTQPVLILNTNLDACLLLEMLDEKLVGLRPAKLNGKRYTITYIPVLN